MKKLIPIILITLSLVACHSAKKNTLTKPQLPNEKTYLAVEKTACLQKHGYKNNKYCNCFANVKSQILPETLKNKILKGDSSAVLETVSIMIANKTKLDACDNKFIVAKAQKVNISIPDFEITDLARDILAKSKGILLTPNNRNLIKPVLPLGYEFYMKYPSHKPHPPYIQRLTDIKDSSYYFTAINERNVRQNNKKYEHGIAYYLPLNDLNVTKYSVIKNSKCIFVLNKVCEFTGSSRKRYQMYTTYKDGLWISVGPTKYSKYKHLTLRIFGIDGLPLYIYQKKLKTGSTSERVRFEPGETWLNYIGK